MACFILSDFELFIEKTYDAKTCMAPITMFESNHSNETKGSLNASDKD